VCTDSIERARLLACLSEEIDPRDDVRRCEVAAEAIDIAHRIDDDSTTLAVLTLALNPLCTPDTLERRLRESELASDLADRVGDQAARFDARSYRILVAGEVGDIDAFDACLAEMETISEPTGTPFHRLSIHMYRGWRHLLAGRTAEAAAEADTYLELGTKIGVVHTAGTYGALQLQQEFHAGRLAGLVDIAAQGMAENPTIPGWRTAVTTAYCELGASTRPRSCSTSASQPGSAISRSTWCGHRRPFSTPTAPPTCAAPMPRPFCTTSSSYADRFAFISATDSGSLARALGRLATLLGRYDVAEHHLRDALAMHERMGGPASGPAAPGSTRPSSASRAARPATSRPPEITSTRRSGS